MATAGQVIENPLTQHQIIFRKTARDTQGALFELEHVMQPYAGKAASAHVHPDFVERFEIITGSAAYVLGGVEHQAQTGDVFTLPAGIPHIHPWSVSNEELRVRQTTMVATPDLKGLLAVETFVETMFKLAREGKLTRQGLPKNLFQFAVLFRSLQPHTYIGGLPIVLQRGVLSLLAPIGHLLGYKTQYA